MAFTAEQLAQNPSFLVSIRFLAGQMRGPLPNDIDLLI